jgi:branched-chain amino acid transport system substrate-binding protein
MSVGLTGYLAAGDQAWVEGVKLAVASYNNAGGIDNHPVQLHIVDMASSAPTGVTVVNQLINQYNVNVLLNGASSAQTAAIAPLLAQKQVPLIMLSQLPADPTWCFVATVFWQKQMGAELAIASNLLHAKKIAFVWSNTPYGQLGSQAIVAKAQALGMQVVLNEAIDTNSTDLSAFMSKVKDAQPDAVLDFLTGSPHIVMAKAATTVNLGVPLIEAPDNTTTFEAASAAYSKVYVVASPLQYYPDIPDTSLKPVTETFRNLWLNTGGDPSLISNAADGWDAVQILAKAINTSHAIRGDALRAALETTEVQGAQTLFHYSASDHSGQLSVPTALVAGQYTGTTLTIVYRIPAQ